MRKVKKERLHGHTVTGTGSQCPWMAAGKGSGAGTILPYPAHTDASKGKEFLGFLNLYSISVYNFALSVMGL